MNEPNQNPSLVQRVIEMPVVATIYRTQSPYNLDPPKAVRVWRTRDQQRRLFAVTAGLTVFGLVVFHRSPKSSC